MFDERFCPLGLGLFVACQSMHYGPNRSEAMTKDTFK